MVKTASMCPCVCVHASYSYVARYTTHIAIALAACMNSSRLKAITACKIDVNVRLQKNALHALEMLLLLLFSGSCSWVWLAGWL